MNFIAQGFWESVNGFKSLLLEMVGLVVSMVLLPKLMYLIWAIKKDRLSFDDYHRVQSMKDLYREEIRRGYHWGITTLACVNIGLAILQLLMWGTLSPIVHLLCLWVNVTTLTILLLRTTVRSCRVTPPP